MRVKTADYVIIGGGTAGCVLAARLTEDPDVSVIVLEAGPHHRGLLIHMPAALGALYDKGAFHWPYVADPEPHAADKTLPYKMGRIVGGSSAINGQVWARGNPLDFDDWKASGCRGWEYGDLEPLFRRIEAFEDRSDSAMGHDGPIPVTRGKPENQPLSDAFLKAAKTAGYRINPNPNSGDQEGFCALHRNTRNGRRGDVYQGYIHPIRTRKNLTILPEHTVQKIEFDGKTAISVRTTHKGCDHRFIARREIILAAGSIASPQLLELSGIGAPEVLEDVGIPLVHALPGVGQNFHTHPTIAMTFTCSKPVSILNATRGIGKLIAGARWLLNRRGPAATTHFEAGAFLKSHPDADRPDYQLTFLPLALAGTTGAVDQHGFQVYVELVGCQSRGQVHIASTDINAQPRFRFNYLQDAQDVEIYKQAIATIRNVVAQQEFDALLDRELVPGATVTEDAEIEAWIRKCASFSHHLVGSCKMGPTRDPLAVVDPELRVHGLRNIRVVDASIMPNVTSANTHAATIVIAEKAAERWCQTNANQSLFFSNLNLLGCEETAPLGKSSGAVQLEK
ncbi:GMC family oxidoreductase [Shimia gijangensis]|nr:GMC family oxidoreductase N-terminal domain-containing protein [Shimia gijangensis]